MDTISNYSNGNYEAQVAKAFDGCFTVTYRINNRIIRKTNHITLELAQTVAEDFILEGGGDSNPEFLSE
jgi:hypothetical protein